MRVQGCPEGGATALQALLDGLLAEPDPHTTIRQPLDIAEGHFADSLSGLAEPRLRAARRIADIGAGAGFPGLVLAVVLREAQIDLVESARRKCEVIERLADGAELHNVSVINARAEEWASGDGAGRYAAVTARALAPLPVIVEYAAPLLAPGGVLVAYKGERSKEEERAGQRAGEILGLRSAGVTAVEPFPGTRARNLHSFVQENPLPAGFPRRSGIARKRPLGMRQGE